MLTRRIAVPLALMVVVAGCGGEDVVDREELEKQVQTELTKSVGQQAPKAVCTEELTAEVGESTRCYMDFPENKRLGITVKVKSKDGDSVRYDILADDKLGETPAS